MEATLKPVEPMQSLQAENKQLRDDLKAALQTIEAFLGEVSEVQSTSPRQLSLPKLRRRNKVTAKRVCQSNESN